MEAIRGIDQALVVSDIDTPPDGNITLTLNVSQGLIVLTSSMVVPLATHTSMHFLVVESRRQHRMYITNILESLGHTIEVAYDGTTAYEMIIDTTRGVSSSTVQYDKRRFDCVLVELDLPTTNRDGITNTLLDGFQTARMVRAWETLHLTTTTTDNSVSYPEFVGRAPVVLVSIAPRYV